MSKIIYILGAGFSAPLKLPLVSNFLEKSHFQQDSAPQRYEYFSDVFALMRQLSRSKNYYRTDLFNIEEILSLVDARARLGGASHEGLLQRYIQDVIKHHTPPISPGGQQSSALSLAFSEQPWTGHIAFVAAVLGQRLDRPRDPTQSRSVWRVARHDPPLHEYAVISLNYDLVLEHAAEYLSTTADALLSFTRSHHEGADKGFSGHLAKLHGSVDEGPLVPPTWSKSLENQRISAEWEHAARLLREARHVRVIGYSLPPADSYVRYLLRNAAIDVSYLSRFDVTTLDPEGEYAKRYRAFVDFPGFRFETKSTEAYLGALLSAHSADEGPFLPSALETAHRRVFRDTEA